MLFGSALGPGVLSGFTTRLGGVSAVPYESLNLGRNVGDDPAAVRANSEALARKLGVDLFALRWAEQVHGARVAIVDGAAADSGDIESAGVDALVTRSRDVVLCIRVADCLPVLLADVDAGVVAAAHAGRKGLSAGVLASVVTAMESLGASPEGIHAEVGPAICARCYELSQELVDEFAATVPDARATSAAGTPALDLRAVAFAQLARLGVQHISISAMCTVERPERWFSYRRDGTTGRFAGFIALR